MYGGRSWHHGTGVPASRHFWTFERQTDRSAYMGGAQARTSALQAAFEPPFLMASRLAGWRRVVEAVEALLTRVACLESAIEGATGEGAPNNLGVRACMLYGV